MSGPGDAFSYEYDFGDSWIHEIRIEKALPADPAVHYPRCLAGERACPPEDCGGPPGYEDLPAALQDPAHPRHEEICERVGSRYDLTEVNRLLWRLH
ncbi:plasmid pRiA4b ORF-3-like protein [bacterium BMS3Bbin10]|nr:plasmid pRiA4b ORF-3-like protein [bacterium BMS3Bbin10]